MVITVVLTCLQFLPLSHDLCSQLDDSFCTVSKWWSNSGLHCSHRNQTPLHKRTTSSSSLLNICPKVYMVPHWEPDPSHVVPHQKPEIKFTTYPGKSQRCSLSDGPSENQTQFPWYLPRTSFSSHCVPQRTFPSTVQISLRMFRTFIGPKATSSLIPDPPWASIGPHLRLIEASKVLTESPQDLWSPVNPVWPGYIPWCSPE